MRDIYIIFSTIYFLAGGLHLYQQYKQNELLKEVITILQEKQ